MEKDTTEGRHISLIENKEFNAAMVKSLEDLIGPKIFKNGKYIEFKTKLAVESLSKEPGQIENADEEEVQYQLYRKFFEIGTYCSNFEEWIQTIEEEFEVKITESEIGEARTGAIMYLQNLTAHS